MSMGATGHSLGTATKELLRNWEETKESWNDAKAHQFEEKYLAGLIASVERALPIFEDLDKILNRLRRDCE